MAIARRLFLPPSVKDFEMLIAMASALMINGDRQTEILQTKLRDLELAQLRMAPALALLNAEYRNALAAYLGQRVPTRGKRVYNKYAPAKATAYETLAKLNGLDAQRRSLVLASQFQFR